MTELNMRVDSPPMKIRVQVEYIIEVGETGKIPWPLSLFEEQLKEKIFGYGLTYGGNRVWYVDPASVEVKVEMPAKKKWYERLYRE